MSKNHYSADNLPEPVEHPKDPRFKDRTGQVFGRLKVLYYVGRAGRSGRTCHVWLCRCECGQHLKVLGNNLHSGDTRSCGCLKRESIAAVNQTHGLSSTPEYTAWHGMLYRCESRDAINYSDYGGRGIQVCDRWRESFEAFLEDMGTKPTPKHSIDRIDNDGNYCPENCRWATKYEQVRNTRRNHRITFRGETLCVTDLARRHGIGPSVLQGRLRQGWSIERAISAPLRFEKCKQ